MRKVRFLFIDLSIVSLSAILAFAIRDSLADATTLREGGFSYSALSAICVGICIVFSGAHRAVWRYFSFTDASRLVVTVTVALLLTSFVTFAFDRADNIPRSVPFIHWFLTISLMGAARGAVRASRGSGGGHSRQATADATEHVLVVGLNHVTELYLRCVAQLAPDRIAVVGILHEDPVMKGRSLGFSKVIGQPGDIAQILNKYRIHGIDIDRIVVAEPFEGLDEDTRKALLAAEKANGLVLDLFEDRLGFTESTSSSHRSGVNADKRPSGKFDFRRAGEFVELPLIYRFLKRAFDIVGAFGLIILLAPLFVLTAFVVALDVGPPLTFWQVRPGRFGVPFKVLKFRTMRPAHDAQGQRIPDADRQSRIGKALRRTRLDELPQLFNILKGDMSFVGPRPLLPVDQPDNVDVRLSVRPGLTGWAQINGGHAYLTNEEKGALDIWYVRNGSFLLDMEILLRTAAFIVMGEKPPRSDVLDKARTELTAMAYGARSARPSKPPRAPQPSHSVPGTHSAV